MSEMRIRKLDEIGRGFVPAEFLPPGKDEYYLRDRQCFKPEGGWQKLRAGQIEALVRNGNFADSWDNVLVTKQFSPDLIKNCSFYGLVRIGRLDEVCLEFHEMAIPVGITGSRIIACDIGDDVAIHNVRYLAHYIIARNVILLNIDEMNVTNHAKFGNGIIKQGEGEDVRIRLDVINETGGRSIMPFEGMSAADAYLWARFRGDAKLQGRLAEITQRQFDPARGYYGTVGEGCVIKNCQIIKDVNIGPYAYIKGANKLKNLTILSAEDEPSQIGEGVELVNGIVGRGCHIFYGCKAVRFVMGDNSNLKYGARLIHSYLGDNSTISCCEVLNDLIFPAHEQHHNNSFLTAALVKGQSNIAAAATLGSNHNSRSNDGELEAGRGFWPGLCVSIKHYCRFASFTLLAKGDYPAEMDIPLPFSLVSNDCAEDRLLVMPGYWWLYNMYALARNAWKFRTRDKRKRKMQHIEFDAFAPDTAEEMFTGMRLLERWVGRAAGRAQGGEAGKTSDAELESRGRALLTGEAAAVDKLQVFGENMEQGGRPVVILKARQAYAGYRQMLHYYGVRNLLEYLSTRQAQLSAMSKDLAGPRQTEWDNLGGQLVQLPDVRRLLDDINSGFLSDWIAIHQRYDQLWERYPLDKQKHAFAALLALHGWDELTVRRWNEALDEAVKIQQFVRDQVYLTRKKDYDNPFRQTTFRSEAERLAVLGSPEDNTFVKQVRLETQEFEKQVEEARQRA